MKKYLVLIILCLSILLVSCGMGVPREVDIKVTEVKSTLFEQRANHILHVANRGDFDEASRWYKIKGHGYINNNETKTRTEHELTGKLYMAASEWDTKAYFKYETRVESKTEGITKKTTIITYLEGVTYIKETTDKNGVKGTSFKRIIGTTDISFIQSHEVIESLYNPVPLFSDVLDLAKRASYANNYTINTYQSGDKYGLTSVRNSYENKLENEQQILFEYDSFTGLIRSLDYYVYDNTDFYGNVVESFSISIDPILFGIIFKPFGSSKYVE